MLTAARSVGRAVQTGRPLPEVDSLYELYHGPFKFRPRFGQVTLIAGQPKSLKSQFALFWAAMMNLHGLYFSADMAEHTAITRLAACLTGDDVDTVADGLEGDGEAFYAQALEKSRLKFCYNPNPTLADLYGEIDAWVEWSDSYPQIIIIDNLMDVLTDGDSEHAANKSTLLEAKTIARLTGASVFVLHHMSEAVGSPLVPSSRKSLQGKVSQTPESVLSVARDGDRFKVSVVAARNNHQDASGEEYVTFRAIPEKNRFERWVDTPTWVPRQATDEGWWQK